MTDNLSRDDLIEAVKKAAAIAGNDLSRSDFQRTTGISQYHIYKLFPEGGWAEIKRIAGLDRNPKENVPLSDDELLQEYNRVVLLVGNIPTWAIFTLHSHMSADVIRRRFGGLQGTLKHYREWLVANEPESPILSKIEIKSKHEIPIPPSIQNIANRSIAVNWQKISGPEFGSPINFRGLRHAPINEQGVVFLFGMVSYELGFIVEAIHAAFPDCEAKRCIDRNQNRWQRVRIEFEFKCSNFYEHGHNPSECDLVVCWENNWPNCPLEVIELRRVIDQLDG